MLEALPAAEKGHATQKTLPLCFTRLGLHDHVNDASVAGYIVANDDGAARGIQG